MIAMIGAIGLIFCIFVMPFTQYAKDRINDRFDHTMVYIYMFFMWLTIIGAFLRIWLRPVLYAAPARSSRSKAASLRYVIYAVPHTSTTNHYRIKKPFTKIDTHSKPSLAHTGVGRPRQRSTNWLDICCASQTGAPRCSRQQCKC